MHGVLVLNAPRFAAFSKEITAFKSAKRCIFCNLSLSKIAFLCCLGREMCANLLKKEVLKRNKWQKVEVKGKSLRRGFCLFFVFYMCFTRFVCPEWFGI